MAVVTMVRMMAMVAMVVMVPVVTPVVASMVTAVMATVMAPVMRATVLGATALVPRVTAHETTDTTHKSSRAAATIRAMTPLVSVALALAAVAVAPVLELALDDVGGHSARGAAQERAQLALAELVAEEAASTASDQRGAEAALTVFTSLSRSRCSPLLVVVASGVRFGRVGSRRRIVGRQVASLLLVARRRRPPRRREAYVGVGGAGARVLWMRRVGREVGAGLLGCVLLLRRVRGRRVAVLRLRGVLVLGWIGAARTASTTAVVVVCS